MTEQQRARRNLHPHAEARLAMSLWSERYAFQQSGGSMDFWDSLTERQQRLCRDIVDGVLKAAKENGRAALAQSVEKNK